MKLSFPELALIAVTRGMLGAGIGLLAAGQLSDDHRRLIGRTLLGIGLVSTVPLLWHVGRKRSMQLPDATSPEFSGAF